MSEEAKTKKCSKCGKEKYLDDFYKDKGKSGRKSECKKCISERTKEYREKNSAQIKKRKKEYYRNNKDKILKKVNSYRESNKDVVSAQKREYRNKNKEKIAKKKKEYNFKNKEHIRQKNKEYYEKNKEQVKRKNHEYEKYKMKTDAGYKMAKILRRRLNNAVKNNFCAGSAVRDLGCSVGELKIRFEAMFYPHPVTGEFMTWGNYGKWHIDHIVPLSAFDLTKRDHIVFACHYTNLQPLWAEENLKKGAKVDG